MLGAEGAPGAVGTPGLAGAEGVLGAPGVVTFFAFEMSASQNGQVSGRFPIIGLIFLPHSGQMKAVSAVAGLKHIVLSLWVDG